MKILVTGSSEFIGSHLAMRLHELGDEAIGFGKPTFHHIFSLCCAKELR